MLWLKWYSFLFRFLHMIALKYFEPFIEDKITKSIDYTYLHIFKTWRWFKIMNLTILQLNNSNADAQQSFIKPCLFCLLCSINVHNIIYNLQRIINSTKDHKWKVRLILANLQAIRSKLKPKNKIKNSYRLGTFQVLGTFAVDMPDIGYGLLCQQDKLFVLHNGN